MITERLLPEAEKQGIVIGIEEVWNKFLLSPLAQANVLQYGSQIPTNPKAPAVGEGAAQVAEIGKWMKNAVTLDWETVNANRPAWNSRWNKTIER